MKLIVLFMTVFAWLNATSITLHPDSIMAISFPPERISFANGDVIPEGLHIMCGWWDRPDSNENFHRMYGTCDFIHANYAHEQNMTCYANNPRLRLTSTLVTCQTSLLEGEPQPRVLQDSCSIVIEGTMKNDVPLLWNPTAKKMIDFALPYNHVMEEYGKRLDHQIVVTIFLLKATTCRFNATQVSMDVMQFVADQYNILWNKVRESRKVYDTIPSLMETWDNIVQKEGGDECYKARQLAMGLFGLLIDVLGILFIFLVAKLFMRIACLRSLVRVIVSLYLISLGIHLLKNAAHIHSIGDFFMLPKIQ